MDQGKALIRLALFGRPVESSLSPVIHRMFADQFDLAIDYQAIDSGIDEFPQKLEEFRHTGGTGCNITLPLKRQAWQLASDCSAEARRAEAANTLVYQPSSGWFAHTTDGAGLIADLCGNQGLNLEDQRLLILGAGGAVAGILGSLLACGPAEVVLVNRNLERARQLVKRFSRAVNMAVIGWQDLDVAGAFDLVINATSLGHTGQAPRVSKSLFSPGAICYDLNYFKASQALKERCQALQLDYIDGLGMLVEQAAKSFQIWTGEQPDTAVVIDSCRRGFSHG